MPKQLQHDPHGIDPYMRTLHERHLLRFVDPEEELWGVQHDSFKHGFTALLEQADLNAAHGPRSRIHVGKMGYSVFSDLRQRGLAERDSSSWNGGETWLQVESSVADLYMAYLAAVISGHVDAVPVTDRSRAIAPLAGTGGTVSERLRVLRYVFVTDALPSPRGAVPPSELERFKEKHADKLQRCKRYVDGVLADIVSIDNPELQDIRLQAAMAAIADDVASLREKMKERRWPGVSLIGLGGVVGAALTTAAVVAGGGTPLAIGLGVGAGLAQVGAASYSSTEMMRRRRLDPRAPLAYAALASSL